MESIGSSNFSEKVSQYCIVKFGTDWCGPCRVAKNVLKQIEAEANIPVFEVNAETERDLFEPFRGQKIPVVVLYRNGEALYHFQQTTSKHEYMSVIERYRNGGGNAKEVS